MPAGIYRLNEGSGRRRFTRLAANASVVALGETLHTSGGLYSKKAELIKLLVGEHGFRVVAFETPWAAARRVDEYIASGRGEPDEALDGLFGVWRSEEVRELLEWLRDWNSKHPGDGVRFVGFDIQQPWDDVRLLKSFLAEHSPGRANALISGLSTCAGVEHKSHEGYRRAKGRMPSISRDEQRRCLAGIERIASETKWLERRAKPEDLGLAHLSIGGLKAWQQAEYYEQYAGKPEYLKGFQPRDEGMASAFLTLRALFFPSSKTVMWAANFHISRRPIDIPTPNGPERIKVMGYFLSEALGEEGYVPMALTAYELKTDWPSIPNPPPQVSPSSLPKALHKLQARELIVDLWEFDQDENRPYQVDFQLPDLPPRDHFRALIFVDRSPAARMIKRKPVASSYNP